ncbi:hypothetical protein O181_100930, partial [Austropuccinia psidii MF-1]|nr:hypothetical protein [Austropuccinia psidii MF-1]
MVQQVYCPALGPFVEQMEQAPWIRGQERIILIEDNVPIHMVDFRNQWPERNRIVKMEWTAHSPDLCHRGSSKMKRAWHSVNRLTYGGLRRKYSNDKSNG